MDRAPWQDVVVVVGDEEVRGAILKHFPRTTRWEFLIERTSSGFTVTAKHPASAGIVFRLPGLDGGRIPMDVARILAVREFEIADAAPALQHPTTVHGLRALAAAFDWPTSEVRAVAYLLYEAGALTCEEAGWLAGFEGHDAPMVRQPPE